MNAPTYGPRNRSEQDEIDRQQRLEAWRDKHATDMAQRLATARDRLRPGLVTGPEILENLYRTRFQPPADAVEADWALAASDAASILTLCFQHPTYVERSHIFGLMDTLGICAERMATLERKTAVA